MTGLRFFVVFIACWAMSAGAAVPEGADVKPPGALQALQRHAVDIHKTVSEQINTIVDSKNTQDLGKAIKQGSDSVLKQLSELSKSLQEALSYANRKIKEALEQAKQNLEHTAEELRKAHPDVEHQATALRDKLQTAVQNTVQETQKLAKEVAVNVDQTNQKLAPKIKEAYDDFVKEAEQVQKQSQPVTTKQ